MRDYISVDVLANWVSMLRSTVAGAIWLIDDDDEARFYERFAHKTAQVLPARATAARILEIVRTRGIFGVVATVGSNFGPLGATSVTQGLFQPEVGDVASLLVTASCFDAVVQDGFGSPWRSAVENAIGAVREAFVCLAVSLSRVRAQVLQKGLPAIDWEDISTFINWDSLEVSPPLPFRTQLETGRYTIARNDVREQGVTAYIKQCDGNDVIRVLALASSQCRPHGISARKEWHAEELASMLRTAYALEEIESDGLYWSMRVWERANPRYPLLRQWRVLDPLGVVSDQRYWEPDLRHMSDAVTAERPLSVLKMDLDNFKAVNESLGHTGGDEAIRIYCEVVRDVIAAYGETYRRGGDEVVAIVLGLAEQAAIDVGEQIRELVERRFQAWGASKGLRETPTASIGVVSTGRKVPFEKLCAHMDEAQKRAKEEGKNRVVCARID